MGGRPVTADVLTIAPRDPDAEADLLCAVMVTSGRILDDVDLTPAEFYTPAHETIYTAALTLHAAGKPVETTTLADYMLRDGTLNQIGGPGALADIYGRHALPASATHYAGIIRDRAIRRAVVTAGTRLQQLGITPTDDPGDVLEQARAQLDAVADRAAAPADDNINDILDDVIDAIDHGTASIPTPWDDLNHLIGGWRKGDVYVVAARPGSGKSIVGGQAASHAMINQGLPVVVASLEMSRRQVVTRWISQLADVNLGDLNRGGNSVGADQWERIARAQGLLRDARWIVDDRSSLTVSDIRNTVRACRQRHGDCGLLVVDYLQLVRPAGRAENRQNEVASISRALKVAAKDLDIPIVVCAQLNRGPEGETRAPRPSDLRESGAIEQDADVIMLMHRDAEKDPGTLAIGLGKNRNGPISGFQLDWQGHYARVVSKQWRPSDAIRNH
jgi:replicative DNA helicase